MTRLQTVHALIPEDAHILLELCIDRDIAEVKPDVLVVVFGELWPFYRHQLLWAVARCRWWWLRKRHINPPRATASVVAVRVANCRKFYIAPTVKNARLVSWVARHLPTKESIEETEAMRECSPCYDKCEIDRL